MTRTPVPTCAIAAILLASCGDATAPNPGTLAPAEVRLTSGLAMAISATPDAVAAGDSITARVTVRNPTSATVRVTSSCTAIASIGLGRVAPPTEALVDSYFSTGCGQALATFTLAPGDSLVSTLRAPTRMLGTGAPLPPGAYYVKGFSNLPGDQRIGPADGPVPNVTVTVTVR